ncbi:MAG: RagB/SusD family nutrient uptake outer membrane protein, partial [Pseudoxanthomonas sp.]
TNVKNSTSDAFDPTTAPPLAAQTGYYTRKMCDSNIAQNSSANTNRGWPLLRYAEVILSYAESINEVGQTAKAYEKMIELRSRAGIDPGADGLYGMKPGMSVAEMREIIRNERHIELAYEGDFRWDDIRRWKIAEVVNNGKLRSILIERNPSTMAYTYKEVLGLVPHFFTPKQYLFPIPGLEIRKMPLMIQNPGW